MKINRSGAYVYKEYGKGKKMDFLSEKNYMNDIHMHVIPGVDDGSWNLDMSYAMLYMAYRQGVRKVVATPHSSAFDYNEPVGEIFQELKEYMNKKIPDIELYMGCEVHCTRAYLQDVLHKLNSGIYPSMNGTKYVLTEFSTRIEWEDALFCVGALLADGWIPVIAHVERYKHLFENVDCMEELKVRGALLQINVFSVFEECDEVIKRNAISLVERGLADFLGSDAHRTNHRPPSVEYGLKYLYDNFDHEYVQKIAFHNADRLLLSV